MKYYAGIGSRALPPGMFHTMMKLAEELAQEGYVLRSGGADGADTAFETGCNNAGGLKEIFLPTKGFNRNKSTFFVPSPLAFEIAARYHPAWNGLDPFVKKLMARNVHQTLGQDCKTPSDFIVCYTRDGSTGITTTQTGGTGQAIRIAHDLNVPIFNLKNKGTIEELRKYLIKLRTNEEKVLRREHTRCTRNRLQLEATNVCSCFHCLQTYSPSEIVEWCDEGETAICPKCGIDSVLPNETRRDLLVRMYDFWFTVKPKDTNEFYEDD